MIKKYKIEILIIMIFMTIAGFLSLTQIPKDYLISNDGCSYADTAKSLAEGRGYTYMGEPNIVFPPIYPFAIACLYKLSGNKEQSAILVSSFAWILTIIPLTLIALAIFKKNYLSTIITMLIIAASPQMNGISRKTQAESLYIFIISIVAALFIYWVIQRKSKKPLHFIVMGLFLGIACLTRPEGLILALILVLYTIFIFRSKILLGIKLGILMLISFFVLTSPYIYYLYSKTGHLMLSGRAGLTLVGGENIGKSDFDITREMKLYELTPDKTGVYMYRGIFTPTVEYLLSKRADMIHRILFNLKAYFVKFIEILFPFGLLLLIGNLVYKKLKYEKKIAVFLFALLLPVTANLLFFLMERYLYQYLVFILFFCGIGLVKYGAKIEEKFSLRKTAIVSVSLIIILAMNFNSFIFYFQKHPDKPRPWNEVKELGLWMKDNISDIKNEKVVGRKAIAAFYSGAEYKAFPWIEDEKSLYDYMKRINARYLQVDTRYFYDSRPNLYYLVETDRQFDRLKLIKSIENKKHKAVLYQFIP